MYVHECKVILDDVCFLKQYAGASAEVRIFAREKLQCRAIEPVLDKEKI